MARITRAQSLTGSTKNTEYYSDFMTNFTKTPVGDQLARVINEKSINQSLKNLISTGYGERLFQPYLGSNVRNILFDNDYSENYDDIIYQIENTINNSEKRVNLIKVEVSKGSSENDILISIVYNTINNSQETTFEYILKRVR